MTIDRKKRKGMVIVLAAANDISKDAVTDKSLQEVSCSRPDRKQWLGDCMGIDLRLVLECIVL
jgi:hypothetical protein